MTHACSHDPGRSDDFVCPAIADAEEVASLPWIGNFASDSPLFDAVYTWAITSAPTYDLACRALFLAGNVGMGLDDDRCQVTADFVRELCDGLGLPGPTHYSLPD